MDSQVKERLVGAAVLVALGVWLIPWVLDGPDEPARQDDSASPISLPSAADTTPVRTETIELDPGDTARESIANRSPSSAEPTTVAIVASESPDTSSTLVQAEPLPAAPAPMPAPAPGRSAPAGWSVQVGAFGEIANAEQLATRVSTYGYAASVYEFRGGSTTLYRVRVGGLESETDAEAAASALSARGFPVQVIAPE
ncbi:MAG TPA: SPOR domain-containing protein [Gammaproteobacteria bacterium]